MAAFETPAFSEMSVADFCRACRAYAEGFVGTMSAQFQRLDTDGDGLISFEEALQAEKLFSK